MIRKRATCSTSSTLLRDSGGFHAPQMGVSTLCPPAPILLTSCGVNSHVARGIYFGKLSRACTRANVRRSKAHRWRASMARSWLPLRDVSLRLNKSDEETNPSFRNGCVDWKRSSSWRMDRRDLSISDDFIQSVLTDKQFVRRPIRCSSSAIVLQCRVSSFARVYDATDGLLEINLRNWLFRLSASGIFIARVRRYAKYNEQCVLHFPA